MRPPGCTATARATNVSGLVSVETRPSPENEASRSPGAAMAGGAQAASATSAAARRRTLTSMSPATLPAEQPAVLDYRLAVGAEPPAPAQVADHVPVHGRLVDPAGLGVRAADREVDGAADLLV